MRESYDPDPTSPRDAWTQRAIAVLAELPERPPEAIVVVCVCTPGGTAIGTLPRSDDPGAVLCTIARWVAGVEHDSELAAAGFVVELSPAELGELVSRSRRVP